jgi:hypothetical protein
MGTTFWCPRRSLLRNVQKPNEKTMTLHELFIRDLKDLNSAENQLVKALPKMVKAAASSKLKKAFQDHLVETKNQAERIKQAFDSVCETPKVVLCKGMAGLVEEGKEHIENDAGDVFGADWRRRASGALRNRRLYHRHFYGQGFAVFNRGRSACRKSTRGTECGKTTVRIG